MYLSFKSSSGWFISVIVVGCHRAIEYHTTLCLGSGSMIVSTNGANWWCQKSSVSCTVFTCSRQNLQNKNKEDLAESTGVVPANSLIPVYCRIFFLWGLSWLGLIVEWKIFPCIDIDGGQARPCWIRRPLLLVMSLTCSMVSRRLTKVPVEFHCGVTFGVVGLSLSLVFVKLTDMWVPSTFFVRCFGDIKFMTKISLSYLFLNFHCSIRYNCYILIKF